MKKISICDTVLLIIIIIIMHAFSEQPVLGNIQQLLHKKSISNYIFCSFLVHEMFSKKQSSFKLSDPE